MTTKTATAKVLTRRQWVNDDQRKVLRDIGEAFISSRLLIWIVGVLAVPAYNMMPNLKKCDPLGLTRPFNGSLNLLIAPFARWDSVWFLHIANNGGYIRLKQGAFFPLYPFLARIFGTPVGSSLLGGIVVSGIAFAVCLYLLHRLVELEIGERYARAAVFSMAFFPMAFFFSAVYSESLFTAVSLGSFYAARRKRWVWAALLGAAAAATRNIGVLMIVPLVLLFLFDRGDGRLKLQRIKWDPRILWFALIPLTLFLFLAYLGFVFKHPLAPLTVQAYWQRHFHGPFSAVWEGILILGKVHYPRSYSINLMLAAFLVFTVVATIGIFRRLPKVYGIYMVLALLFSLSFPAKWQPLMSLPRFLMVLFPIYMWLALVIVERSWVRSILIPISAGFLVLFTVEFATWRWVA